MEKRNCICMDLILEQIREKDSIYLSNEILLKKINSELTKKNLNLLTSEQYTSIIHQMIRRDFTIYPKSPSYILTHKGENYSYVKARKRNLFLSIVSSIISVISVLTFIILITDDTFFQNNRIIKLFQSKPKQESNTSDSLSRTHTLLYDTLSIKAQKHSMLYEDTLK